MTYRHVSAAAAVAVATVAVGALLGAGTAAARPYGTNICAAQPVGSGTVTTCTNTDDAPASVIVQALCSNLRIIWINHPVAPNSTRQFIDDCGPGAHPVTWNAPGTTQWQEEQQAEVEEWQLFEEEATSP